MSPEKTNAGKPVQLSKGFIVKQFQNTIWVPEMAHPTENALDSSTSQSEKDISPNLPHEISQRQPPRFALASLAQRLPNISLSSPTLASMGFGSVFGASMSPTLALLRVCAAPGCLYVASGCFYMASSWLCVNPLPASALMLPILSLPLCYDIHCPSTTTLITPSISLASLDPENQILDQLGVFFE